MKWDDPSRFRGENLNHGAGARDFDIVCTGICLVCYTFWISTFYGDYDGRQLQ
jgi:hypothetical protein